MAFNIVGILSTTANLLEKNNSTASTYDISSGLNTRVKTFKRGVEGMHEKYAVAKTMYPAIFVELSRKREQFDTLGRVSNRTIDISVDIVCVTDYGAGIGREVSDTEIITLSQNVEELIRNFPKLSSTSVLMTNINESDYSVVLQDDTYNKVARIGLEITTRTT